jgi:hypothetical protein
MGLIAGMLCSSSCFFSAIRLVVSNELSCNLIFLFKSWTIVLLFFISGNSLAKLCKLPPCPAFQMLSSRGLRFKRDL